MSSEAPQDSEPSPLVGEATQRTIPSPLVGEGRERGRTNRRLRKLSISAPIAIALAASLAATADSVSPTDPASLTAGALTVARFDHEAYLQPAPELNRQQMTSFRMGRHHFDKKWASLSSLQFEWGLGPTFIAKSCEECHTAGGRGRPPQSGDEQLHSMLVRVSIPGEDSHGGPKPHPNYGDQFQNLGLNGPFPDFAYHTAPVPPEAALYLDWEETSAAFPDGESVTLRRPKLRIENLAYGPLGEGTMTSLRITQPLVGLGLLEAVPEETLLAIAKEQQTQGVNGRPNYVRDDVNDRTALGRFGWKANQPSIRQQIAAASLGDMGLTTRSVPATELPAGAAPVRSSRRPATIPRSPSRIGTSWSYGRVRWRYPRAATPATPASYVARSCSSRRSAVPATSRRCGPRRSSPPAAARQPDLPPLHRPAPARHGRRPGRWPSRLQSRPARLAHRAAVEHRPVGNRQRQYCAAA